MITFEVYEAGEKVGMIQAANIQDALLDYWDAFLHDDYTDPRLIGNMLQCKYDGKHRTFTARAEQ